MENKNQDIYHSKIYLFLNALTLLGYLILYPLITKFINPSTYGNYILLYAYVSILINFCNLGCSVGFRRNFFEISDDKNYSNNLLYSVQIFILIIFGLVLFFLISFESSILKLFSFPKELESLWILLVISLMLDSYSKYFFIYLENKKKSKIYFLIFFLKTYFYFIISILLVFFNKGILSLVYGLFYSNLFLLLISTFIQYSKGFKDYNLNFSYVKKILIISIPSTPRLLFGRINSDIDKILISFFINSESTGIYAIGQSIAYSIFQIISSLDKVFIPEMYKLMFAKKFKKIGTYLRPFLFFFTLITLVVISSTNLIVDTFLDIKYSEAKIVIIIFSIYYFTLFFSKVAGHQLVFLKKVWTNTFIFFINIFLNIILSIIFIYYLGFYGAAFATAISSIISLLISIKILQKWMIINYDLMAIKLSYFFLTIAVVAQLITLNFSWLQDSYILQFCLIIVLSLSFLIYGFTKKIISKKNIMSILYLHK